MSRTRLINILRQAYQVNRLSQKHGIPSDEVLGMLKERKFPLSRRRFLQGGLALAGATAATAFRREGQRAIAQTPAPSPILVVGAGIAGLTAAYRLQQAGVPVDIVEARHRVGGRMRSLPNAAGTPIRVEMGGEFISTSDTNLRNLAAELGFNLIDLHAHFQGLVPESYFFEGRPIPMVEIVREFAPAAEQIAADLAAIENFESYAVDDEPTARLDNISLAEYLESLPTTPMMRKLLEVAYVLWEGVDADRQSSINLLYNIGAEPEEFALYGEYDERYQIDGGSDQITFKLAELLANSIETGTALESLRSLSDGRYRVGLRSGLSTFDRTYERVLLALPFSVLRHVEMNVELPPAKRLAIETMGYGTNSKLIAGYRQALWRDRYNASGEVYSDLAFQSSWAATPFASVPQGAMTIFTGGTPGAELGRETPETQAQKLLPGLDRVFPGLSAVRIPFSAVRAYWTGEVFSRGSYSSYHVGQYTQLYGVHGERVGNLFFAGEHCSLESWGFMEGGCETGETAALAILEDLGLQARVA